MATKRASGILLHPTSLPGRFGIGDLGPEAFRWVDFLAAAKQKLWQVLPLGQTGFGDSPYQCFSAFAGNAYLISPEALVEDLDLFLQKAVEDPVPMVRWHLAMLLGHLSIYPTHRVAITNALLALLEDQSVFTQSWAIVSLCILGRQDSGVAEKALDRIARLAQSPSAAIRTKVRYAIPLLKDPHQAFPKGWVKSTHLQAI